MAVVQSTGRMVLKVGFGQSKAKPLSAEAAMNEAAAACQRAGITDPEAILAAKMKARTEARAAAR